LSHHWQVHIGFYAISPIFLSVINIFSVLIDISCYTFTRGC
jgi:hypothetical protein